MYEVYDYSIYEDSPIFVSPNWERARAKSLNIVDGCIYRNGEKWFEIQDGELVKPRGIFNYA